MNLNISVSTVDLEEALLNSVVSHEEAFNIIKLLDTDIMQDWDFTEMLAKHFVLQMKQMQGDESIPDVWNHFEAWLKEELK